MRKSSIIREVKYLYDLLNIEKGADKTYAGNVYRTITNWKEINASLHKLNEFDFMGDSVERIFALGASYQASTENTSILNAEYDKFINLLNIVRAKCQALIDYSTKQNSEDLELFMKLPDDISDVKELSSLILDINVSFNLCPVLRDKVGKISFHRVEEGSNWVVFVIEACSALALGAKALEFIANFIYKCNEIRLQNVSIDDKKLDVVLKRLQITDEEFEKSKAKYDESLENELHSACIEAFKKLEFSQGIDISPDEQTKIVHSMKTLIGVLERGTEFYPSTSAEENIQKMFPKQEEFKKIENVRKLIEDSKEEES